MRSGSHFVRRVAIPVVVLVLVVVSSYGWLRAGRVPGQYVDRCQAAIFEEDAPPADVLLIGASRTGFGIDEAIIDGTIDVGSDHRTEKIVLLGNAESDSNLALRTYLRERGAPDTVGFEILITRTAGESLPARRGAALTNRTYALFGADAYSGYLGGLVDRGVVSWSDVYARSYFPSPVKFFFDHLQIGFDNALRSPRRVIDALGECGVPHEAWEPVRARAFDESTPMPSERKIANLRKEVEQYVTINVDSRRASGEIAVMRDMVESAKSAGVKNVFFYYFPSFGETIDMIDLDRVAELVPGAPVFDARRVILDPERPGLDLQFRDRAHLNEYGAHEVTVALRDFLEGFGR